MHSKIKGSLCELKIATRMIELGHIVSFPYGENSRYDMIVDVNKQLYRIQCKTGLYKADKKHENDNTINYYFDSIDYIASYCPQVNECYIISIKECPPCGLLCLRFDLPLNNQHKNIKWANDYIL